MMNLMMNSMDGWGDAYSTHPHVLCSAAQSRMRGGAARGGATMNEDGSPLLRKLVALCTAPGRRGRKGKGGKNDQQWQAQPRVALLREKQRRNVYCACRQSSRNRYAAMAPGAFEGDDHELVRI